MSLTTKDHPVLGLLYYVIGTDKGVPVRVMQMSDLKFINGKLHQRFISFATGATVGWFPVPSE